MPRPTDPKRRVETCSIDEMSDEWLDGFTRRQDTEVVWRSESHGFREEADRFRDDWDDGDRVRVVTELRRCVNAGGVVLYVGRPAAILGFAAIESDRFGPDDAYVELSYLHVTAAARGRGIGRLLFARALACARSLGASHLYIGAHPARDTQRFYRACGCVPARWTNPAILHREPRDIQLECAT